MLKLIMDIKEEIKNIKNKILFKNNRQIWKKKPKTFLEMKNAIIEIK